MYERVRFPVPVQENIGAMQITRVGSKIVIQAGAVIAIIFGIIGGNSL